MTDAEGDKSLRLNEKKQAAIAVAPNGGRLAKTRHPGVPITPEELAACASACLDAGAAMFHIHVRDRDQRHLLDADAYREALRAIRASVGDRLVLQITTEALGIYEPEFQAEIVRQVRPEAASLALREFVPDAGHEKSFADLLAFMAREKITPQIILYSPEEAVHLQALIQRGVVPFNDLPVLYVLGRYTQGQRSAPIDLLPFLGERQPDFSNFMVCAFGPQEAACVTSAALLGGHVRVGFENNTLLPDGSVAESNAQTTMVVADTLESLAIATCSADALRSDWQKLLQP
ncbi:3-keto-5-aminohexanoate cleavage protein [Nitratireductor basaltis]|nr:3-keto-5-aminohexanoate cleavage protein [Nitratireductor basaltis]